MFVGIAIARALLVAANSQEEKDKWIEDINQAVESARELSDDASRINYFSLKSCSKFSQFLCLLGNATFCVNNDVWF